MPRWSNGETTGTLRAEERPGTKVFDVTLFALGLFLFWAAFITWVRFDWIDTRLLGGRWNRLKRRNSNVEELDPFRRRESRGLAGSNAGMLFVQVRLQLPMVLGVAGFLAIAFAIQRMMG